MGRRLATAISEPEFKQILAIQKDPKKRLAYCLAFYQGLRISEIVGLRSLVSKCCNELVVVEKRTKDKLPQLYLCSGCGKELAYNKDMRRSTDKWQILPLTKENIDLDGKKVFIKGAKGRKDRNIVLMPEISRIIKNLPIKMTARNLEHYLKKDAMKAINKNLKFHDLRHSCATTLNSEKGWDIRLLQDFLGHSRLDTTMIYTHIGIKNQIRQVYGE